MSMQICKEAYQELIDGDIKWLLRQPRDLERDHIEAVLRKSVELLYGKEEQLMYRPITMYQIVCDRCGEVFGGTDTCSALFSNKEVDIGDYSDWEMIDGKHYCPDCYEVEVIDGVYNVKANRYEDRKYQIQG